MKILVIGASGFLGRHVCRAALADGLDVVGTYRSAPADVDGVEWVPAEVTDPAGIDALMAGLAPDAVVNAVMDSSGEPAGNWGTNAVGAVNVARATARHGVRLVHMSSDAVHRGRPEIYPDDTPPDPVYPYGAAKAAAELAVGAIAPAAVVVRVSLIMSDGRGEPAGRERFMVALARGEADGMLYADQIRCPVIVDDVADACVELAANDVAGPLNLGGPDILSWYDIGRLVAVRHGLDPNALPSGRGAERRPGRIVLDSATAGRLLRVRLRGLTEVYGGHSPG